MARLVLNTHTQNYRFAICSITFFCHQILRVSERVVPSVIARFFVTISKALQSLLFVVSPVVVVLSVFLV